MRLNTMTCKQCQGEMRLTKLDRIDGEEHGVHLILDGLPAMRCDKGHTRLVAPTFATEMMDTLLADEKLVPIEPAERKGLLLKRDCCPSCGARLGDGATGHVELARTLQLEGVDPFGIRIDLPTYSCPSCGRESVESRHAMTDDLMKASVHAFHSVDITPA